ncbi:MAG: hypothetical protein ACRED5_18865 [Propylenella sp.]
MESMSRRALLGKLGLLAAAFAFPTLTTSGEAEAGGRKRRKKKPPHKPHRPKIKFPHKRRKKH